MLLFVFTSGLRAFPLTILSSCLVSSSQPVSFFFKTRTPLHDKTKCLLRLSLFPLFSLSNKTLICSLLVTAFSSFSSFSRKYSPRQSVSLSSSTLFSSYLGRTSPGVPTSSALGSEIVSLLFLVFFVSSAMEEDAAERRRPTASPSRQSGPTGGGAGGGVSSAGQFQQFSPRESPQQNVTSRANSGGRVHGALSSSSSSSSGGGGGGSTFVYYVVTTDGDDFQAPNAFRVPKKNSLVTLADVRRYFPLPGTYHFRYPNLCGHLRHPCTP